MSFHAPPLSPAPETPSRSSLPAASRPHRRPSGRTAPGRRHGSMANELHLARRVGRYKVQPVGLFAAKRDDEVQKPLDALSAWHYPPSLTLDWALSASRRFWSSRSCWRTLMYGVWRVWKCGSAGGRGSGRAVRTDGSEIILHTSAYTLTGRHPVTP